MIKKIIIENFQSHRKTIVRLKKGVNILTGRSDSGKTAIIRALNWVFTNRPSGLSFIRKGSKQARVRVVFTDGTWIERIRSKKVNEYRASFLQEPLKAIGTDVPGPIKLVADMDAVNLQKQFDAPFLLTDSPGKVAAYFNKLANISIIDEVNEILNSRIRRYTSDKQRYEIALEENKSQLEELAFLGEAEIALEVIETLEEQIITTSKNYQRINKLIKDIEQLNEKIEKQKAADYEGALKKIKVIVAVIEQINQEKVTYNKIRTLLNRIFETEDKLFEAKEELKIMKQQYKEDFPAICPLCGSKVK